MRLMKSIFQSYGQLDANGRHVGGTDKMTNHNYGDAYEQLFFSRSMMQLVMEIGIADGSSMKAWREIFPNALIVGMDTQPCAAAREQLDRMEFHIGNQRSRDDCERAAAGRAFDFILDDAVHELDAQFLTLFYLWPFVRPGGQYVIEEFADIGSVRDNLDGLLASEKLVQQVGAEVIAFLRELLPQARIVDTQGPFGGIEPLYVLRKPL